MRGDFPKGSGRAGKREMSFSTDRTKKKKRRTILRVSPGRQNEDEVFKPAEKKDNNV